MWSSIGPRMCVDRGAIAIGAPALCRPTGVSREMCDFDTGRDAEVRDNPCARTATGHGSLRTTCVVAAQVCDPGFRCGTKASRQRARVTAALAILAAT